MFEKLIKRTIWVWKCPHCGATDAKDRDAPKERLCKPCGQWTPYVEQSAIGPDLSAA